MKKFKTKRTPVRQYGGSQGLATCVAVPNLKSTAIFANKYQVLLYHLGRHLARGVIFILKKGGLNGYSKETAVGELQMSDI